MQLSKIIPARRLTITFRWCREWTTMSERFRAIRSTCGAKMDKCFWCKHKFADGEKMFLAQTTKEINKVLCHNCAHQLMSAVK